MLTNSNCCPSDQSHAESLEPFKCAACDQRILDRYLLKAIDKYWHENCLTCAMCNCRLTQVGSSLFVKKDMILCKTDYLRVFGLKGKCSACSKDIPACEMVMRAGKNVYHLECFGCQDCHCRFCVGEKFYLDVDNNRILCEDDFKERMVLAQMATCPPSKLNTMKRDSCRKFENRPEQDRAA
ncbi:LIM domain only protein 3 [Trichinella nativa]|uniref:LIM domain only protein 3 n=2 Tax=Trichinella TaxID=6333 RepID=A0A0V1L0Q0_9BILA|nr:LIM domain only protein 3 [Trichinella murrelli]KRX71675.1 LIM domain only protein 3 [Trichinella sp. T6]KRX71676.1 LIM domain only protein 3 [Trichinella sp. T6]KRZ53149.1 LIM domain only protein 3 [Trichinella nativa]